MTNAYECPEWFEDSFKLKIQELKEINGFWSDKAEALERFLTSHLDVQTRLISEAPTSSALREHKQKAEEIQLLLRNVPVFIQVLQLEKVGLQDHPKAHKIYNHAWDRGHACGYNEVFYELQDLAEIFKD